MACLGVKVVEPSVTYVRYQDPGQEPGAGIPLSAATGQDPEPRGPDDYSYEGIVESSLLTQRSSEPRPGLPESSQDSAQNTELVLGSCHLC